MEYYILDEVAGNPDIPYIGELPQQLDMIAMITREVPKLNLPIRLPVTIDDESEVEYPDMMTADVPLFSERLKNALDNLGVTTIDYFPVELFEQDLEKVVAHYYLGIIHDMLKCLKSGVEKNQAGRKIIKNPVIAPMLLEGQMFFRLYERPRLIIINSFIKEGLERAGLQGVSMIRLEDYVSC